MNDEYDLFGGTPPHQKHSRTSRAAAESIRPKIGPLHKRILLWMENNPNGGCDERVATILDMVQNTYRPRRIELVQMGRIKDSGRTELTRSGKSAVTWIKA